MKWRFIYINKYIRGIKNLQRHKLIIQVLFCNARSPVMACYLHYVTFPIIFTASMLPVCFVYSCRLASGKQTESESAWSKGSDEILWVFNYTDPWKHSSFSAFAYRPTLMGSKCTFKSLKRQSISNVKLLHQVKECKLVKHQCWSLKLTKTFFSNWLWPA